MQVGVRSKGDSVPTHPGPPWRCAGGQLGVSRAGAVSGVGGGWGDVRELEAGP